MTWVSQPSSRSSYQKTRNSEQIDVDRSTQSTVGYYDVQPYWNNSVDAVSQEINLTSNGDANSTTGYFLYQKLGQDILELEGSDANPTFNATYPITVSNLPYNFNYGLDSSQKRYSYAVRPNQIQGDGRSERHNRPALQPR
jgi:iron complex outermembrane receptor protein